MVYAGDVNMLGGSVHTLRNNIETLVMLVRRVDWKEMLIKLSTWSCLEIRIKDEVTT